jgi:hypothetical protein
MREARLSNVVAKARKEILIVLNKELTSDKCFIFVRLEPPLQLTGAAYVLCLFDDR